MINLKIGNILSERTDVLVNTVNCVGVMGRGVALEFKNHFPKNYTDYKTACNNKQVKPGKIFVHATGELCPRFIFNFPTKRHWRGKSKIEDIEAGMASLVYELKDRNVSSIALTALGCGLGGLDWNEVLSTIKRHFEELPNLDVVIYEPGTMRYTKPQPRNLEAPEMNAGRAALILLVDKYLRCCSTEVITLPDLHMLMYFLQAAGEPLRLKYKKTFHGPYAENLNRVLRALGGHYVSTHTNRKKKLDEKLSLVPGALEDARKTLDQHPDPKENINRVADLVTVFEFPHRLELLATTHWLIQNEQLSNSDEIFDMFQAWNTRKPPFTKSQITRSRDVLQENGWA